MNKKSITVTVGIPAYNEEANIVPLLKAVLGQKEQNFHLKKIIVISDASNDRTDRLVKSVKSPKIRLYVNRNRKGQIYCQNKIFAVSNTDTVVLLEADTYPRESTYLAGLIAPLIADRHTGYSQGNEQLFPPRSLFELVLYTQFQVYQRFVINDPGHRQWLCSGRGGRAFKKSVYRHLRWPASVPEDVYALLWLKKNKINTSFQKGASLYHRLPQTFADFYKTRQKLKSGQITLAKYFSRELIARSYRVSYRQLLKMSLYFIFRYPLEFFTYSLISLIVSLRIEKIEFTDYWPVAGSTKSLL